MTCLAISSSTAERSRQQARRGEQEAPRSGRRGRRGEAWTRIRQAAALPAGWPPPGLPPRPRRRSHPGHRRGRRHGGIGDRPDDPLNDLALNSHLNRHLPLRKRQFQTDLPAPAQDETLQFKVGDGRVARLTAADGDFLRQQRISLSGDDLRVFPEQPGRVRERPAPAEIRYVPESLLAETLTDVARILKRPKIMLQRPSPARIRARPGLSRSTGRSSRPGHRRVLFLAGRQGPAQRPVQLCPVQVEGRFS